MFVVDLSGSMTARKRLAAVSELCGRPAARLLHAPRPRPWSPPGVRPHRSACRRHARWSWRCADWLGAYRWSHALAEGLQTATEVIDGAAVANRPVVRCWWCSPTAGQPPGPTPASRRRRGRRHRPSRHRVGGGRLRAGHDPARYGTPRRPTRRAMPDLDELTPAALHIDPGRTDRPLPRYPARAREQLCPGEFRRTFERRSDHPAAT